MPVSTSSTKRKMVSMLSVKIEVVRPYSTPFAKASASSRFFAVDIDSTGPKISSLKIRIFGSTLSKMVGSTK
jgi:hypothetical protein